MVILLTCALENSLHTVNGFFNARKKKHRDCQRKPLIIEAGKYNSLSETILKYKEQLCT